MDDAIQIELHELEKYNLNQHTPLSPIILRVGNDRIQRFNSGRIVHYLGFYEPEATKAREAARRQHLQCMGKNED